MNIFYDTFMMLWSLKTQVSVNCNCMEKSWMSLKPSSSTWATERNMSGEEYALNIAPSEQFLPIQDVDSSSYKWDVYILTVLSNYSCYCLYERWYYRLNCIHWWIKRWFLWDAFINNMIIADKLWCEADNLDFLAVNSPLHQFQNL